MLGGLSTEMAFGLRFFALLLRFFYPGLSSPGEEGRWAVVGGANWPQLVLVLSMVTMTLGNLAALQQTNLKRLLAYSSVAHAGYALMGFVVLSDEGLRAVLFYMIIYYLMNIASYPEFLPHAKRMVEAYLSCVDPESDALKPFEFD